MIPVFAFLSGFGTNKPVTIKQLVSACALGKVTRKGNSWPLDAAASTTGSLQWQHNHTHQDTDTAATRTAKPTTNQLTDQPTTLRDTAKCR